MCSCVDGLVPSVAALRGESLGEAAGPLRPVTIPVEEFVGGLRRGWHY